MLNWIQRNQIFERLFDPKTHLQLMVRSNELLSIYLNLENALQPKYMDLIWNLMIIEDIELRPIIFKLITTISSSMQSVHIQYFQEKLALLPTKNLQIEHINLIFEMNKYQIKNQILIYNAINILWSVVEYQSQFYDFEKQLNDKFNKAKELEDNGRTNLCDLLKNYENTEKKYELAKYLIQNIKNRKVESSSLKTLSYLISLCNTQEYMIQIAKEDVINIILQYIKQLDSQQPWQTELQAGYMNSIQERVLLIKSILRNSNITIDYNFINIIWKEMIMNPLIKQESDLSSKYWSEIQQRIFEEEQ